MKPKEQKSQALKQAKGLARWGWIKRYLGPALKYAGISSNDFDIAVLGMDQFVKDRNKTIKIFPSVQVEFNGTVYEPTGNEPPSSNIDNGWWYVEWQWTPQTGILNNDDVGGEVYQWNGIATIDIPPRYSFKAFETGSELHQINPYVSDSGTIGWTRFLLAKRIDGIVESFGSPSLISIKLSGAWSVYENL